MKGSSPDSDFNLQPTDYKVKVMFDFFYFFTFRYTYHPVISVCRNNLSKWHSFLSLQTILKNC